MKQKLKKTYYAAKLLQMVYQLEAARQKVRTAKKNVAKLRKDCSHENALKNREARKVAKGDLADAKWNLQKVLREIYLN